MVTRKQFANKLMALSVLPALSLGVFAAPTLAYVPSGDVTTVVVSNSNAAVVSNIVSSSANTGYNTANGGKGGNGGSSSNYDTTGGNGGAAHADADTGNGGDAYGSHGVVVGGDSGSADALALSGAGGKADATSDGGNGGAGGDGGTILTGDASSVVSIQNDINSNDTDVEVTDCGCDKYNETAESADHYSAHMKSFSLDKSTESDGWHKSGSDSSLDIQKDSASANESHWAKYTKTYVPVVTTIAATNENNADVANVVGSEANTGDNVANGMNGGKGGSSANMDTDAGNGGAAHADADTGNGGDAVSMDMGSHYMHHGSSNDDPVGGTSGAASATSVAGDGAAAASNSMGGDGGKGGNGGVIVTGYAETVNAIVTVANRNIVRIKR